MIELKKGTDTITITINNTKITLTIGEWSRIIAREGRAYGIVQSVGNE